MATAAGKAASDEPTRSAKSLLNRGKTTSIDEAAEPKDLKEYGLEPPQLLAILSYRKKDAADDALQTMNVAFGNAVKDDDGNDESYYFHVDVAPHAERVYLVRKYRFDGWSKELKDFLPDPEPEPEPEETESSEAEAAGDGHDHDHDHDHGDGHDHDHGEASSAAPKEAEAAPAAAQDGE